MVLPDGVRVKHLQSTAAGNQMCGLGLVMAGPAFGLSPYPARGDGFAMRSRNPRRRRVFGR